MQINIGMIKVNSISSIGSLNVGKTILCKNEQISTSYDSVSGSGQSVSSMTTIPGTPGLPQMATEITPESSEVPPSPGYMFTTVTPVSPSV